MMTDVEQEATAPPQVIQFVEVDQANGDMRITDDVMDFLIQLPT